MSRFLHAFSCLFQSNPHQDLSKIIGLFVYFSCVLVQILMNSFYGSRLSHETDGITHAIYASPWMDRNEKCKRAVRIFVVGSMRPMAIWAGGLFELSLPTFVRVSAVNRASFAE